MESEIVVEYEMDPRPKRFDCKYKLKSVIHHLGRKMLYGHYTADVYTEGKIAAEANPPEGSGNPEAAEGVKSISPVWEHHDDEYVSEVADERKVLGGSARETAYIMFYELQSSL